MEGNRPFSTNNGYESPSFSLTYHGSKFENNEINPTHQSTQILQTSSFTIPVDNRLIMPTVRDIANQLQHDVSNMQLILEHSWLG